MNKRFIVAASILGLLLAVILIFYWVEYEKEVEAKNIKKFLDFQTQILNKNIEEEKLSAMTVAVLLSEHEQIKDCFLNKNREMCLKTLKNFTDILHKVPIYQNVKFHIHTKDMKSFARSWIPMHDDDLVSFRHMLEMAKNGATAGIEVGRSGVFIRAVAPIWHGSEMLGSIEVLLDFEYITNFFKEQGLDLFVLLDKSPNSPYQPQDVDGMMDEFYIINKKYTNLNILPILKDINFKSDQFYNLKKHNFTIQPMNDMLSNKIGYFVIYFNSDSSERNLSKLNIMFKQSI